MALRVTLIGHYPPPYGGVATLMKQMEGALVSSGCGVTIFNLGHGRPEGENVVSFDTGNRLREVWQLFRAFAASDSDVFHYVSASYRSFWLGSVCLLLAKLTGKRIVISFIGGAFADFIGSLGPLKRAVARTALSMAAVVVACNSEIRGVLGELVPGATLREISNCFPVAGAETGELQDEVEEFLAARSPVVSSTGAASPEYGLVGAVEALDRLHGRHPEIGMVLVLTRYGTAAGEKELEDAIRGRGASDRVLVVRDIPDFLALLRRSDVFLRSTLVDGDSMSVREALYLGVPTVASDTPFRPHGVVSFRKGDVDDMTKKLATAIAAGRGGASGARREGERNLEALLGIYASVSGRGSAPGSGMAASA